MSTKHFLVMTSIILMAFSCEENSKVTGVGEIKTREVSVDQFDEIRVVGDFNLNITHGDQQKVEISAQDNIFNEMTYEVENGEITFSFKDKAVKMEESVVINIVMGNTLESLDIEGKSFVDIAGVNQGSFNLIVNGYGDITAFDFPVKSMIITAAGTIEANVTVQEKLKTTIEGLGTITYKGHPTIEQNNSGLVSIVSAN